MEVEPIHDWLANLVWDIVNKYKHCESDLVMWGRVAEWINGHRKVLRILDPSDLEDIVLEKFFP